jgi:hypothetical protein
MLTSDHADKPGQLLALALFSSLKNPELVGREMTLDASLNQGPEPRRLDGIQLDRDVSLIKLGGTHREALHVSKTSSASVCATASETLNCRRRRAA